MTVARADERHRTAGLSGRALVLGMLGALAALALAAGPASALPAPALTINGATPGANSPKVNVTLDSQGGDGNGGALYILTIAFPASNATGDEITMVSGKFNTAEVPSHGIESVDEEVGSTNTGSLFNFFTNGTQCFTPGAPNHYTFSCLNFFGGFGPGDRQSYVIDTNQNQNDPTPLSGVNVTVALCGQTGSQAFAADNCAPPGPTKITGMKINQQKRTASFSYKANHAMHYQCELLFNKVVKYRASCGGAKKYAGPLAQGQYVFLVWGVNSGGGSAKPAMAQFTIG